VSRYPAITEADILKLREYCLEWEADGNKPRGNGYTDNVDLRRNIIVYVNRAGNWHLRRDWRTTWNEKYPAHAVDPVSTLKPKKEYRRRDELDGLVHSLKHNYDPMVAWVKHRDRKWYLYHHDGHHSYYHYEIGRNINEAYEWLDELYEAFQRSCAVCGCDWRLTPRVKDAWDSSVWYCPECGDTGGKH
jgi:hypothetical protein